MKPYQIKQPIYGSFKGKYYPQSVGIATFRIGESGISIEVMSKDRRGRRKWPHVYEMNRITIKKYPIESVKGVRLYIIPIKDFAVKEWRNHV